MDKPVHLLQQFGRPRLLSGAAQVERAAWSDQAVQTALLIFGLLLLASGWLVPGHYPPWVAFQQQLVCAAGAILLGFGAVARRGLGNPLPVPRLAVATALLACVPIAQFGLGQVKFLTDGVLPALYLAGFSACVVIGAALGEQRGEGWARGLLLSIAAAAIASTGIALLQWLSAGGGLYVADLPPGERPYGNLAQPNHLATLLCVGFAAILTGYEKRWLGGPATVLALAWLALGILMTKSRTAWLFVPVLVVWWSLMHRRAALRVGPLAMACGVVLFVLALLGWDHLNALLLIDGESLEQRTSQNLRLVHWTVLLDAIGQRPWFGYGWLNVAEAQQAAALGHAVTGERLDDSHNVVIDLMVWMGVPAAVLFAGIVAWLMYRLARACRDPVHWGVVLALAPILTHALLEYPLDYLFFLLPLGLLYGTAAAGSDTVLLVRHRLSARLALAALLVFAVSSALIVCEYLDIEESSRRLRFSLAFPTSRPLETSSIPKVMILDEPRDYQKFWLTQARPGMSEAELDWMRAVMLRNSAPPAMLRYAMAAGLNRRTAEAEKMLRLICNIQPEARCREARESWTTLQKSWPQLSSIAFPVSTH